MTRNLRIAVMSVCLAILGLASLPTAKADEWDKKTVVTFSGPVRVENTRLPAGTYVFKLMSGEGSRHVVQIFDKDETKLYATVLTNAASRVEPSENTEITFAETSTSGAKHEGVVPRGGMPIKQWFYPGDTTGQEFPSASASSGTTTEARAGHLSMPETASPLPLIGLIGLLSLSVAAGLQWVECRQS